MLAHRVTGAVMWTLLLCLIALAVTSCRRASAPFPVQRSTTTTTTMTPAAATSSPTPRVDPAVGAAVGFEQRWCSWTWRTPRASYVAAQQQLATPGYARELAAASDPVSWRREVVAGRQTVTCTITAAQRLIGAPSTSTSVYVRMSAAEQITSTLGSFSGGTRIVSWLVRLVDDRWLVAAAFNGG